MRIIGGKDYYDGGLAYGHDDSIVFVRKREETRPYEFLPVPSWRDVQPEWTPLLGSWHNRYNRSAYSVFVYFCGRLYVGFSNGIFLSNDGSPKPKVAWDLDQLVNLYKDGDGPLKDKEITAAKRYFDHYNGSERHRDILVDKRVTIATRYPKYRQDAMGVLLEYEQRNCGWNIDGDDLGILQFYKVKDVCTAFQEISMWVGGVLPKPGPEMAVIKDEKIRIEKRGFDSSTSFRKAPGKKKK